MTTISTSSSTALLLLQQASGATTAPATTQKPSASDTITSVASGQTKAGKVSVTTQPSPGESKVAEQMFGVNNSSIIKQKLDLIDRAGKALGVDQADYDSREAFVDAMQKALGQLKIQGGDAAVHGLEKQLGLDKLGVSLQDVIDSAKDPEANDKLTQALKRKAGMFGDDTDGSDATPSLGTQTNDIGLYGPAKTWR
jgi:hypothetical protein